MKTGMELTELATELQRQADSERDFIVGSKHLSMNTNAELMLPESGEALGVTDFAHGQMADFVEVPRAYYRRMQAEDPSLLSANVNRWLRDMPDDSRRMVRSNYKGVRALVSDKFRRELSNYGVAKRALEIAVQERNAQAVSQTVTDTRLYLKFVYPGIEREIPGRPGDVMKAGLLVRNSEVGHGRFYVAPWALRKVCVNGMVAETEIAKYHVGRRIEVQDRIEALLSDRTKDLQDAAVWAEVEDIMRASFDEDFFGTWVDTMGQSADRKIESGDLPAVVDVTRRELRLPASTSDDILGHLMKGGDLTQWGLANAITRTAEDVFDYETATDLETAGGRLIEMSGRDWEAIATAETKKRRTRKKAALPVN